MAGKDLKESIFATAVELFKQNTPAYAAIAKGRNTWLLREASKKLGMDYDKDVAQTPETRKSLPQALQARLSELELWPPKPATPSPQPTPVQQQPQQPAPQQPTTSPSQPPAENDSEHNQALGKLIEQTKAEIRAEFDKTLGGFEASFLKKLKETFGPPVQTTGPTQQLQPDGSAAGSAATAVPQSQPAAQPVVTQTSHMQITLKVPVSAQLVSLFEDWKAAANHRARMEGRDEYGQGMEQFMVDCTMEYFENNGIDYVLNLGNPLGRFIRR